MATESVSFLYLLSQAGPVVKLVMLLLLCLSITSWTIIFLKFSYFRKAFRASREFTEIFWQSGNLQEAFSKAKALKTSPIARMFIIAYMAKTRSAGKEPQNTENRQTNNVYFQRIESINKALKRSMNEEVQRLVQLVPFLATTGNTAPFIGLFGTVWGIMDTFREIGSKGSASLAVVAPGIAEALVATAAGLAVAIPAVISYNYFTDRIRVMDSEMQNFSADLLNLMEQDIQNRLEE
jgi:biopolymer transport protein TolQ